MSAHRTLRGLIASGKDEAVAIAGHQVHDEVGSRAPQRDSPHDAKECEPEAAVGASADDESDATCYRQRSQRFFSYVFADVPFPPTQSLNCICRVGLC